MSQNDRMITLVKQMILLNIDLADSNTPDVKQKIQRQIDVIDDQIDSLVYKLYDLSEEEIKIIKEYVE